MKDSDWFILLCIMQKSVRLPSVSELCIVLYKICRDERREVKKGLLMNAILGLRSMYECVCVRVSSSSKNGKLSSVKHLKIATAILGPNV